MERTGGLFERSVNALAGAWGTARDAWRFGSRASTGRIVVPDSRLDGYLDLVTDGLTFPKLRTKINNAVQGELGEGLKLFKEMESKDGRLKSVACTRRLALTGLDWEVVSAAEVQKDLTDRQLADKAADFVRQSFTNLETFAEATEHLATGIGPNLAVLELVWERGELADLVEVPGSRLTMDNTRDPGMVRVITRDQRRGIPAELPKFVVHMPHGRDPFPFRESLCRPQAMIYLTKALAMADWKVFCEIFGMPTRVGTYRSGATADEKTELADMLANVGSKAWGAFSENVNLQLLESSQRGMSPHKDFVEFCARETAILWLGGHLTTDTTGGTGTYAAAAVQDQVRGDLRDDDISREGRTIRRQIIAPMCAFRFQRDVPLPYFRRTKPEIINRLQEAELFAKAQLAGMRIPVKYAHSRLGIPEPQEGEEVLESIEPFGEGVMEGLDR